MRFIAAAEAGSLDVAAQYLQWPRRGLAISRSEAARQLNYVLNHSYEGSLDSERLSRNPNGSYSVGQPADREWVGTVVLANGERVDLVMARLPPQNGVQIWVFSADTVAEIPRMYENSGLGEFERRLPGFLTQARFGEISFWVPLALTSLLADPLPGLAPAPVAGRPAHPRRRPDASPRVGAGPLARVVRPVGARRRSC